MKEKKENNIQKLQTSKKRFKNVEELLSSIERKKRHDDCVELCKIMHEILKTEPQIWTNNVVSFGGYRNEHGEGTYDYFWAGFASVKRSLVIYLAIDFEDPYIKQLLDSLGKFRLGIASIQINKIADIKEQILRTLIENSKTA